MAIIAEHWNRIRNQIMEDLGYEEEDMDIDSIEDEVNRATDNEYERLYGLF